MRALRDVERLLDAYLNFEKLPQKNMFWLDTMSFLCERFGNPQGAFRSIHIAGSKGKGSVAAMIQGILAALGFKAGLYTSPHVSDFSERISLGNAPFAESVYRAAFRELAAGLGKITPADLPGGREITWFEGVTLYAFLTFRAARCEWAVLETGLGGRLDATNVASPEAAVITVIEREHTEFLGNTLAEIAGEKAGIIKGDTPVVLAAQEGEALGVFRERAAERRAPLLYAPDLCSWECSEGPLGAEIRLASPLFARPVSARLRMHGAFQGENAALAALAVKTALPQAGEDAIEQGLASAFLPARFQVIERPQGFPHIPALVVDGAHTPRSVSHTINTFRAVFPGKGAALLFACAQDKEAEEIARVFSAQAGLFSPVTLTVPGAVKKADPDRLCAAFSGAGVSFTFDGDYGRAVTGALLRADEARSPLLVTGSFYLAGEVLKALQARGRTLPRPGGCGIVGP
ncbi:MAG: bifunctional folylpolyglutamate synthase/dihydrofolate synthase [Spirochaetaceae bacterium]|jgi:dihydrofolate synthase/folylpolyglutamate synthase|nr:bifunctional folylpolyglutamate synthase/dihydrofolate synthase [Spirochaetaceae bacterium]